MKRLLTTTEGHAMRRSSQQEGSFKDRLQLLIQDMERSIQRKFQAMAEYQQKQIGKRKGISPKLSAANQWLKTVNALRRGKGVCRKGIYKFKSFEEADRWMEEMILSSSTRESQP